MSGVADEKGMQGLSIDVCRCGACPYNSLNNSIFVV